MPELAGLFEFLFLPQAILALGIHAGIFSLQERSDAFRLHRICRSHHPEVFFSVKIGFDLIADLRVQLNVVRLPVAVAQPGLEARLEVPGRAGRQTVDIYLPLLGNPAYKGLDAS